MEEKLEKQLKELREKYKTPAESELILKVGWDIINASKSLIPDSALRLAQDKMDVYEASGVRDPLLVDGLWGVIESVWETYGKLEVARR